MSTVYFPGCKYTIHSRVNSRKIRQYLIRQHGIRQTGCCSTGLDTLREEDTAVYTCPTCSAFMQEYTPKNRSLSIWEILENDEAFPWPDYSGDTMTVQDCWRSFDNRPMQDAVRHILGRMNVETVEIAKNFEKTDFCGSSLMKTQSPRYTRFAPVRFFDHAKDKFIPLPPEEQERQMQEHGKQFTTEKVVCYCTGCLHGLKLGGVNAVHLMDLISARL